MNSGERAAGSRAPGESRRARSENESPTSHPRKHIEPPLTKACFRGKGRLRRKHVEQLSIADVGGALYDAQYDQSGNWDVSEVESPGGKDGDVVIPVSVLDGTGVRNSHAVVRFHGGMNPEARLDPPPSAKAFSIVTTDCVLPSAARLERRRLAPLTEGAERAAAWASRQEGTPMRAVGEVRGRFGSGVDRLVVVGLESPLGWLTYDESGDTDASSPDERSQRWAEFACQAEFVIAMKGSRVWKGIGVQREIGKRARRKCLGGDPSYVYEELGLAGVADVDGDGVEEALWTWALGGEGAGHPQILALTWFDGTRFETEELAISTYSGSDTFLDPERCGRSKTKWGDEDDPCALRRER